MMTYSVIILKLILVVNLLTFVTTSESESDSTENETLAIINRLYSVGGRVRPGINGAATKVLIDFYVQTFGPLNEADMEFDVDLDFRATWFDPRLVYHSKLEFRERPIYISASDVDRFWLPDIYFPNDKRGKAHDITIPNRSLRIYHNGTVKSFCRMAMAISCTMHLYAFPLDKQLCFIRISTYSYDTHEIVLDWTDEASIEIKKDELTLPQFDMIQYIQGNCTESYKTGVFSCLQAKFLLKRKIGFFVLQTYIPSILIVALSWVSFWINKNSEPARIALGVTTILTMTTQLTTSRSNQMRVSYPKAIDVWYSACMVFVFAALLEYAFVNVSVRVEVRTSTENGRNRQEFFDMEKQESSSSKNDDVGGERRPHLKLSQWSRMLATWKASVTSKDIDHFSRRIFPAAFLVFNLVYWTVYSAISATVVI